MSAAKGRKKGSTMRLKGVLLAASVAALVVGAARWCSVWAGASAPGQVPEGMPELPGGIPPVLLKPRNIFAGPVPETLCFLNDAYAGWGHELSSFIALAGVGDGPVAPQGAGGAAAWGPAVPWNSRLVQALTGVLAGPNSSAPQKAAAARALGRMGARVALLDVAKTLKDSDSRVRGAAIEALGDLNDPRAAEFLVPLLHDVAEWELVIPPRLLAPDLWGGVVGDFTGSFTSRTCNACQAARVLGQLGPSGVTSAMVELAESASSTAGTEGEASALQVAACDALGRMRDVAALPVLNKLKGDENPRVRYWARRASLEIEARTKPYTQMLSDLESGDPLVRFCTLRTLAAGNYEDEDAVQRILNLGLTKDGSCFVASGIAPCVYDVMSRAAERAVVAILWRRYNRGLRVPPLLME